MRAIARILVAPHEASNVEPPAHRPGAVPGHRRSSASLRVFRTDRAGLLLRIARGARRTARVRVGLFSMRGLVVSAPALAHEVLVDEDAAFVKATA